ncbi:DUF1287 domain-containing protein [Pseudalkalibacillus berkeleyi]|uniref:DUF1287 domain-containing protein n=1 Tax=Pseudalkalibacillus berkeleyi TaxID=1069813 RepID=A0ABS9H5I9_9BACL|nr:DUF1287 domain-containing protein [Pseudalkalibacillus berkeleyi]MCF6139214.1 DUF1287 domain-containing protein [Pseudalkalibacillus berkeleyi]
MIFLVGLVGVFIFQFRDGIILDSLGFHFDNPFIETVDVPHLYSTVDRNNNGVADPVDVVKAARKEVTQRTTYESNYYAGGYPPDDEGVCTDVVWRGLFGADISLKDLMDEDIAANPELYPRVNGKPDSNIDFRRVPNQNVYFQRFAESLTTELIPGDVENLKEWQPGDIVVFLDGFHHVALISDKRARDGTPYVIHNNQPFAAEVKLSSFRTPIAGHYRWNF